VYAWTASGNSSISFTPNNDAQSDVSTLTATVPSPSLSDTTLTVDYTVNNQSAESPATKSITVRIFFYTVLRTTISAPIGSNYGYDLRLTYDIYTHPGASQIVPPGMSGIPIPETVTLVSSNISGGTIHTGSGTTDANTEFTDRLALISNMPLPPNLDEIDDQDIFASSYFIRYNTIEFTSTTATVTNNGPYN